MLVTSIGPCNGIEFCKAIIATYGSSIGPTAIPPSATKGLTTLVARLSATMKGKAVLSKVLSDEKCSHVAIVLVDETRPSFDALKLFSFTTCCSTLSS